MKIQKAIKTETLHIAIGCVTLGIVMNLVFMIIGRWNSTVFFGTLLGATYATLNFFVLGVTVQIAAAQASEKTAKLKMQLSYMLRNLVMIGVLILGFMAPCFSGIATALCMLFPRLAIAVMQMMGKYKPNKGDEDAS